MHHIPSGAEPQADFGLSSLSSIRAQRKAQRTSAQTSRRKGMLHPTSPGHSPHCWVALICTQNQFSWH